MRQKPQGVIRLGCRRRPPSGRVALSTLMRRALLKYHELAVSWICLGVLAPGLTEEQLAVEERMPGLVESGIEMHFLLDFSF